MKRLRASPVGKSLEGWSIEQTLVTDVFALRDPGQRFEPFLVDRQARLLRTGDGWQQVGPSGLSTALQGSPLASLRATIFAAVSTEAAITYRFGSGAKRVILLTASDCPLCRQMDQDLADVSGQINGTIHVFPIALDYNNPKAMARATSLWCRDDAAFVWSAAMRGFSDPRMEMKNPAQCGMRTAQHSRYLARAFDVAGVPSMVMPNGEVRRGRLSKAELLEVFK